MKKILAIMLLLPIIVSAETCDTVVDNQTTYDRNLVCDVNNKTTTSFKTNKEVVEVNNSVCKISCSEEILISIDPIKKVLAGTSFSYPLYTSGERKCTAVYNYNDYETKIKRLVNEYESLTGTAKTNKGREITNYYAEKKACDEFVKEEEGIYTNKYGVNNNAEVTLSIETSKNRVNIGYKYQDIADYSSNLLFENVPYYNACNFNEKTNKCDGGDETVSGWTEYARIYGKYTMDDAYVEKYTGEIKSSQEENTCNAGDRYFVSFNELTRPTTDDTTDKGYSLVLTASNFSNYITNGRQEEKLNVNCWYQVKNLIFPQSNAGGETDEMYDKLGNTGFMYRIIDLDNPFPNRESGANWFGKESIITSTADKISTLQRFVINLNSSSISRIRDYNNIHSYEPFNIEIRDVQGIKKEYSSFIQSFNDIIDRK